MEFFYKAFLHHFTTSTFRITKENMFYIEILETKGKAKFKR